MSSSLIEARAQILLPFAEKEYVDLRRAQSILGIDHKTVYRLRQAKFPDGGPLLEVVDYGHGCRQRVLYAGIVRYCDWLRGRYAIADRRPRLENPDIFRHRDEDLLPFPLLDTIGIREALLATPYESTTALKQRCEEGAFESYRLIEEGSSPWRISRSSFARWISLCHNGRR